MTLAPWTPRPTLTRSPQPNAAPGAPRSEQRVILAMPPDDALFATVVERLVARSAGPDISPAMALRAARLELRRLYPRADLHRQGGVAIRRRPTEVWFGYRDGRRSTRMEPETDAGLGRDALGSVVFDGSGRVIQRRGVVQGCPEPPGGRASGRGLGRIRDILPAAGLGGLLDPDGPFARTGEVRGAWTGTGSARDTNPTLYRAVRNGAGPGRHVLELRSGGGSGDCARAAIARSAFANADEELREGLLGTARTRTLGAGDRLSETLLEDDWAVLVVCGIVRLHIVADGIEPTIVYRTAGALFRSDGVDGTVAPPLGVQAMTAATILLLDPALVRRTGERSPEAAVALAEESRRLLADVLGIFATRTSASLPRRLAGEILRLRACQSASSLVVVTEQQLADGIGSIRESVARAIATLRGRGWLATTRHGLLVLEPQALHRMAYEPD
jgi:CRP/FNR family cyclic AMP-dependent transcriptional regulator